MRQTCLVFALLVIAPYAFAQPGTITTVAGGYPLGDGGPARAAFLPEPKALATDSEGNLYVFDLVLHSIRKITRQGVITTIAGRGYNGNSSDGGPATAAYLDPSGDADQTGLVVDSSGNLYFSDASNQRIRRIGTDGVISNFAGTGQSGYAGDGGPAVRAQFNAPGGLALDADGDLYVADINNHRVRKVSNTGIITTVVGTGGSGFNGDGIPAAIAQISSPGGLAADRDGNLYIADRGNNRIRRVSRSGVISTVAGGGSRPLQEGLLATEVALPTPDGGIATDGQGTLYLNLGIRVFALTPQGRLALLAGNGQAGHSEDGVLATAALLSGGDGITVDQSGDIYRNDYSGQIQRIVPGGKIETIAGAGAFAGDNGPAVFAALTQPNPVAIDPQGNLYTSSRGLVRKITPDGRISIFAGNFYGCLSPKTGETVPATSGCTRADGITIDAEGNVYLLSLPSDPKASRIEKVTPNGMLSTFPGTEAGRLNVAGWPTGRCVAVGIAADSQGNLYVPDAAAHRVLKVTPQGDIAVFAGNGSQGFSGDGGSAAQASLNYPCGVAVELTGALFIADTLNSRVRKVTPQGVITTVAGTGRSGWSGDGGAATLADIGAPLGLAVDNKGNLYISDSWMAGRVPGVTGHVRKVTTTGAITTIAGNGEWGYSGDGGPATRAALTWVTGLAADPNGNVYLADRDNHRVRRVQGSAPFAVEPSGMLFSHTLAAPPARQTLLLSVPDREPRPFVVSSSSRWLSASPSSGTAGATAQTIAVTASPAGLAKGTYYGRLTFTDPDTSEYVVVPVTMTISGTPQQLKLSPIGLAFAAAERGGAVPAKSISVLNVGTGAMDWTASSSTLSGGNWLRATPVPGKSVTVSVAPAGLAIGTYYGLVTVTAPSADNSPQSTVVMLSVLPADQAPGIVVDPAGLVFTGAPGGTSPDSQTVQAANVTTHVVQMIGSVNYTDGKDWLSPTPLNGVILTGQTQAVEVKANLQGLAAGIYRAQISLNFQPDKVTQRVSVLLVVAPGAGKAAVRMADAPCAAKRLLPVFRSPGDGFAVTAGWPATVEVEVVDDCGIRMNAGQAVASFSNNDPAVRLVAIGEGRWTGVWASRNAKVSGTQITVRAETGEAKLAGEAVITGGVKGNPEQPLIAVGGVLNGASFRREAPVAPGSYVSVFGARLAGRVQVAESLPLPQEMGETAVLIAGRGLPLHFTSEGQVNAVLPYGVADSTRQQMIVRKGQSYSLPEEVLVATSEPAVFTVDGSGKGQGHVYVATEGGQTLADASRPAQGGEVVVVYATGLGPVSPTVQGGDPAPSDPAVRTVSPVKVTIGGKEAEVQFAGLAPGLAGIYQVNARVPQGLTADASAGLIISVGEQSQSPPVTMAATVEVP